MPFDPTDPKYASPLAAMAQDRMSGMLNQPQMKVFANGPQDGGTNPVSPIMPGQTQLNRTMGMAKGGAVNDELAGIKDTIRAEFAARGLDFDRFVQNPAVMDEVGKSIQSQGKNGDTILAHINPEEASLLKEMGGSGTVNPATGLPQFDNPSMGAYDAPSGGYGNASNYTGGSNLGGYGGSGSGSQSWSGGGNDSGSRAAGIAADRASVSGYTGGDGGSSNNLMAAARSADRGSVAGYTGGDGGVAPILSPMGVGGGSIPMGQRDAQIAQATRPESSVPSYDLMSGLQVGGTGNLSGLGQLAAVPSFTGTAIAPQPTSVDLGNTAPQLSDIDFSNISPGMYQGATMPGGISNFAAAPQDPGYTDTGITAMRMAAGLDGRPGTIDKRTGIGYGAEFYMNQLGELAPVAQTPGATILNRLMDEGYNPAFDIYGVGRTNLEQAMLQAGADGNLTAAPGRSMHNFGLAMDVENLPDQGYRDLARIAKEEGWGWGTMQDPAHVQMAPWGAGAAQTARRLGAEPFAGPATTASMFTPADPEKTALNSALDTVSNIAGELFGVTSAQAQTPEKMMQSMAPFAGIDTREFNSPFIGSDVPGMAFPPRSQQQMLDVLGIGGSPIPPERAAPPEQVAGSGVFPSYPQTSGTQPVPVAGKIGTDPQSGRDLFVDINSNEFTVNPGTGARQYTKFSTSTPASPVSVSPSTFVTRSVTPPPQPQTVVTGLTPVQKVQDRAPGASSAGLTGFEAALGTTPVAQAASLGSPYVSYGAKPTSFAGLTPLTPLQEAISSTPSPTVAPRITTGITSPITAEGISPRQEPLDPTQSTSPMTAEQLQSLGVYQTPLKEGQRVRDNFNEAYGDATARGIEVFEWTNPATGKTDFYKSGAPEADLPAKTAKTASLLPGQPAAPQTEYEKTVAALEANDMIANGMSKEEYAAAMGVPVDQVKTRITTQFGPPMAEYYTKTVLESLAGMTGDEGNFAGLMNLTSLFSPIGILGLGAKAGYNAYRKGRENKADGGYVSPLASIGKR